MSPLLPLAEQRAVRKALERLEVHLSQRKIKTRLKPFPTIFLHGLSGTGKSVLLRQLIENATALEPSLVCRSMPAREFAELLRNEREAEAIQTELHDTDLLILEDVQHFPAFAAETLTNIIDDVGTRGGYFLASAIGGPMTLSDLPQRLKSRLAGGLALRLETLSIESRRKLTTHQLKVRKIAVEADLLEFLARQPGECREVVGRVVQLETLARILPVPLRLSDVLPYLPQTSQPAESSLERIAVQVAKNMGTDVKKMRSKVRHAEVTWARQVAMYVGRMVTGKPLMEIGRYFGGRDHTTVIHALAKVEARMKEDPTTRREIERWVKEAM